MLAPITPVPIHPIRVVPGCAPVRVDDVIATF